MALVQKGGCHFTEAERVPWLPNNNIRNGGGKGGVYRRRWRSKVKLCKYNRCKAISVKDNTATTTAPGYRSVMATEGVSTQGKWYFEVKWEGLETSNSRFGVARMGANLLAPIGLDEFGYAWCSDGSLFHNGVKVPWSQPYGKGDTLGCLITIPMNDYKILTRHGRRRVICYLDSTYLKEEIINNTSASTISYGSSIEFFKNGQSMGIAFTNLPSDVYYPTFSLYNKARITVNLDAGIGDASAYEDCTRDNLVASSLSDLKDILLYT